jgi:uncharacterized protein (UPF0335 family)
MLEQPDEGFLEMLEDIYEKLDEIDQERSNLNARKKAVLEELSAKYGINVKAFMAARQFLSLKEKHRAQWDLTYQVARRAGGVPVQFDLFEAQVQQTGKKANSRSAAQA